jgi:hypothetical protein
MTGDALNTVDTTRGDSAYSSTGDHCLVIGVFQDVGNNLVRKKENVIQLHDGTGLDLLTQKQSEAESIRALLR